MSYILLMNNGYPTKNNPKHSSYIKHIKEGLEAAGHKVELLVLNSDFKTKTQHINNYRKFYLQISGYDFSKYDYVLMNHYGHFALPLLKSLRKIKLPVIHWHGEDLFPQNKITDRLFKMFANKLPSHTKHITPSTYFQSLLIDKYKIPISNISVSPSGGIDTDLFRPVTTLPAKKNIIKIGFASGLSKEKGADIFVKMIESTSILEKAINKKIEAHYILYGKEKEKYNALLRSNSNTVCWNVMPSSQMPEFYQAIDILFFPTSRKQESLGLVALEAIACGAAVLGTDAFAIKEYVVEGVSGERFIINNFSDCENKFIKMAAKIESYTPREVVLKNYSKESVVQFYKNYFFLKSTEKIKWILQRWMQMEHPGEDIYRLKQFYQSYFADTYLTKKKSANFKWKAKAALYKVEELKKFINSDSDVKTFKFYAVTIEDVTATDNWRKDFKNNITSPITTISKINNQNFKKFGDIRYVATISRLQHIPILLAAGLTGNIKNASVIVAKQLSDWKEQNPFLKSINWKNGLEAGIRIVNLIYARKILALYNNAQSNEAIKIIDELAKYHFDFLTKHLSLYSSANNHLLFELMGIFSICCNYDFKEAGFWREKSFNWLIKELFKQTYSDGFTKEQSSHYHAEVLNIYTVVFAEATKSNILIPQVALEHFEKMGEALFYLLGNEEELMSVGDSDEGQIIFPYFDETFSLKDSLLKDVFILTGRNFFRDGKSASYFDLRNYFIWEKRNDAHSANASYSASQQKFFKESGYLFLSFSPIKILFDVGEIGLGKLAAHGHADALQILLSINNEPFIIDNGTYQYHSRLNEWRNYFRGTLAHNTISVNRANQAKSGGRMIWNAKPEVVIENYKNENNIVTCSAYHDGFTKQNINVKHTRTVTYNSLQKRFLIEDKLNGTENFTVYFSLHFAPHLNIEHTNDTVLLIGRSAIVQLKNSLFNSAELLTGDEKNQGGWYSPSFDILKPTTTLRLKIGANNEINLITEGVISVN